MKEAAEKRKRLQAEGTMKIWDKAQEFASCFPNYNPVLWDSMFEGFFHQRRKVAHIKPHWLRPVFSSDT